jgi:hypothetical protein
LSKLAERLALLAQFRRLPEFGLLVRVVTVAMTVPLLLRLPLPRLAAVLSVVTGKGNITAGPSDEEVNRIVACVEAAQRAAHPLVRSGCLTRGLTLYWLLRRAGATVELCFGVGRVGHEFAAHCWLVRDGRPYLEPAESPACFEAIYRIPAPP